VLENDRKVLSPADRKERAGAPLSPAPVSYDPDTIEALTQILSYRPGLRSVPGQLSTSRLLS
jgi:hypothetical protein